MPSYTENALEKALDALSKGESMRRVACDYGIPRATLHDRRAGRQPRSDAHAYRQKLSPTQESRLAEWIRVQDALGLAPTHAQIRTFASCILLAGSSATGVGKHWLEGFLRRNLHVRTLRTQRIDITRTNGATVEVIQA